MIGRNPGHITTPGETLSDHFSAEGYSVISVSSSLNRYMRLLDICNTLIRIRSNIDILIINVYGEHSFVVEDISSYLGKHLGYRILMFLHGGTLPEFIDRFPSWTRRVLGRADALIVPSMFFAREITQHGFRPWVIPNMIDISAYPFRHRRNLKPHLFWMRSFYDYYNPLMAVRVVARLRPSVPDLTLVMAGRDKGLQTDVHALAKKLGLGDAVRFPGFLGMAGKVREGAAADIYLNTNNIDNMPVSVLEAAAMGLPIVATNVGGIPDLLTDEETGLLVQDDDDREMAEAVIRLLENKNLAGKLSSNGRRLAEHSSWEQVRPQWEQIFTELMK